jgi:hypothetical protein
MTLANKAAECEDELTLCQQIEINDDRSKGSDKQLSERQSSDQELEITRVHNVFKG